MEISKKEMDNLLAWTHLHACSATYEDCKKKWNKDEEFASFPAMDSTVTKGDGTIESYNPFDNTLESYLRKYIKSGIIDFSVRASLDNNDKVCFYIHSANTDSETADFVVNEDKAIRKMR
jgi:hypothetical protein